MSNLIRAAAERRRFNATGEGIVWALVDSGVDGSHPHFRKHKNLLLEAPLRHRDLTAPELDESSEALESLIDSVGHGTHCAALICGELSTSPDAPLQLDEPRQKHSEPVSTAVTSLDSITGVAPQCKLLSLKVLDDNGQGRTSLVIEALRWIRQVNQESGALRIHGVTLGLAFAYEAERFACGFSPLCVEVNETVKSGVIVVTSAGNAGFANVDALSGTVQGGALMSIVDPGNAEFAITVGSTHSDAAAYGVSYFSSKGPTLDGRLKPDLVAPGERIVSASSGRRRPDEAVPQGGRLARYVESTGGSAAASYVSGGIAALLSARPDLLGRPFEVKRLLTHTARDLQRERYAQGYGAIDLMQALEKSASLTEPGATDPELVRVTLPSQSVSAVAPLDPAAPTSPAGAAAPVHKRKRFAVAISYPGERRSYVQKVVSELRRRFSRAEIFYAPFHEAELVGPDLDVRLERIYQDDSEVIAAFVSREYAAKEWTTLEWRIVRDVIKRRRPEHVIPLRFDDTAIPGLLSIDAFVDLQNLDPEFAADLIIERIHLNRGQQIV